MGGEVTVSGSTGLGFFEVLEKLRVMPQPQKAHEVVLRLQAANPNLSADELSRRVVRSTVLRATGVGVVAGLPAIVPGAGQAVQAGLNFVGVPAAEFAVLMRNVVQMQYTVAGLHGHDLHSPDRQDEILLVVAIEAGAIVPAKEVGTRIGTKIAVSQFNKRVSGEALKQVNKKLGTTVVTKWGTKRGGVALGRMIPFGVGAAIGGGVNYLGTKSFGAGILKYYGEIKPSDGDLVIISK